MGMQMRTVSVEIGGRAIVPSSEPHWNYTNGGETYSDGINLYYTAWLDMPATGGEMTRTVVCRLIIPVDVAQRLREQAGKVMTRPGH